MIRCQQADISEKCDAKPKVLVVDDEYGVRESLNVLLSEDYRVRTAGTMVDGLSLFSTFDPDLIILDIRLPDMSGIEGLRQIRELGSPVAVIMLTGYATLETAQQAIRLGVTDYMDKPFSSDEIMQRVRDSIARSRAEHTSHAGAANPDETQETAMGDASRQAYLANVGLASFEYAHDISNPLTGLIGYLSIMKPLVEKAELSSGGGHGKLRQYLNAVDSQAKRCLALSRRWLELSQKTQRPITRCSVTALLDELTREKRLEYPDTEASNAPTIQYDHGNDPCVVLGDKLQLYRAFNNFVSNSLQAIPKNNGMIAISCFPNANGREAVIRIADNGCGIPADQLQKVFDAFYSSRAAASEKGTGLGLFITDRIIRDHGGRIAVESNVNAGTVMTVFLPLELEVSRKGQSGVSIGAPTDRVYGGVH